MEQYRNNEIPPIEYTPGTGEFRDAVIDLAHYWTAIAEDLHTDEPGKQERTAAACLRFRKECAMFDYARALQWHDPQDVSVHADIPYLPDGGYRDGEVRGHLLDAYIPRDAIVRGGNTLPVYIDIHGGGFTYGYKELNRNFNTHLADLGFGVFSLNYRPAPQTDLVGQLHDIQAGAALDRRAYHTVPRQSRQHLHHRRLGRCMSESAHIAHRAQRRCRTRIRHRTGVGNPPARSFAHLGSL